MKERILKTLTAYLITNQDVLSEEEINDIKQQIKAVENTSEVVFNCKKGGLKMIKQEKYGVYSHEMDATFIMIDTYKDEEIISSECVGWYHGEPTEEDTEYFTGKLKATYEGGI